MAEKPLSHVTVLDLSRLYPGPWASQLLADMGASVIKIEEPDGGDYMRALEPMKDGESLFFTNLNRNKKSVAVNLKTAEGVEIFQRLAQKADVVLESFRPGVMERLGVGYNELSALNPGLVYCAITGYGSHGPMADAPGHDINYLAVSGLLSEIRDASGNPVIPAFQIADVGGGGQTAVTAILAALTARAHDGKGRRVEVSMTDALASWLVYPWARHHAGSGAEERCKDVDGEACGDTSDSVLAGDYPCYNVYRASDGKYLAVGALEEKFWGNLCRALDREEWIPLQFAGGSERDRLFEEVRSLFGSRPRDAWVNALAAAQCCVTPVVELSELETSPHWQARALSHGGALAPAFSFGDDGAQWFEGLERAPALGAHTCAVLAELGYSTDELERLCNKKVICGP